MELLAPVGNLDCLKAAVQNGADSVYFGSNSFSARAFATNFDLTTLEQAILYAKLRNVKTNLTLNTLVDNSELKEAIHIAKKAYEFGIDAIIVQDLGLAKHLLDTLPDLPIHGSTQMTIHNLEGALELEKLGFTRAVLARELSLSEIEYICKNSNIEIETFIHGALCMSYSGQCLFSSMIGGRSGNRGKCAQPCRLPYELISTDSKKTITLDKGYLLSPKDLCGLSYIPSLLQAGVDCLKIEGRMKSADYVATVTRIYRKYIDMAKNSTSPYIIDENDKKDLLQVFNRGGFSNGHLDNEPNTNLVYKEKPNNIGLYLGNISKYNADKGLISLTLNENLSLGDTVSFEKEDTKYKVSELMKKSANILEGKINEKVTIGRMKGNIHIGDKVFKMASKALSQEALATISDAKETKKIPLTARIILKKGEPIVLTVQAIPMPNNIYNHLSVSLTSEISPIEAKNKPLDAERVIAQLSKTTATQFEFKNISVILDDNTFIPSISILNELRRTSLSKIEELAIQKIQRTFPTSSITLSKSSPIATQKEISICLQDLHPEMDYTKLVGVDHVYVPLRYFANAKYKATIQSIAQHFNLYLYMPTIIKANYRNLLSNNIERALEEFNIKGIVCSNIGGIVLISELNNYYSKKINYIANYTLNVFNSATAETLLALGFDKITISPEANKKVICDISSTTGPHSELIVYGKIPVMTANYCLLGKTNKCYPTCGAHCQDYVQYSLKDRLGFTFPIQPDNIQTVTTIYNSKITSIDSKEFNVASLRINILEESIEQINHIVQMTLLGKKLEGQEYTNSNLNREL